MTISWDHMTVGWDSHEDHMTVSWDHMTLGWDSCWDHDSRLGSHDSKLGSHDSKLGSHDSGLGSHDSGLGSHDSRLESHDGGVTFCKEMHDVFCYVYESCYLFKKTFGKASTLGKLHGSSSFQHLIACCGEAIVVGDFELCKKYNTNYVTLSEKTNPLVHFWNSRVMDI